MNLSYVRRLNRRLLSINLPNWLTLLRIALTPVYLILLAYPSASGIPAFIIFMIAALTDALDGYLARKYHLTSDVGKFLDPVADKLFVLLPLIWFASRGVVSVWLVMLIAARDLVISAFRMLGASRGIVLCASALGKMKTVSQIALLGALTLSWGYTAQYIGAAAAVLTVASAAEYIYRNRGILSMLKQ